MPVAGALHAVCPCGSGRALGDCCGRYLDGMPAPDAQSLMRSRYTAYVLGRNDYLLATWHPATRPEESTMGGTALRWIGLQVLRSTSVGADEGKGEVEFVASYVDRGRGRHLRETSRFLREGGRWFYVDGDCQVGDIGRNDDCPCGSGKKFKRCCMGLT